MDDAHCLRQTFQVYWLVSREQNENSPTLGQGEEIQKKIMIMSREVISSNKKVNTTRANAIRPLMVEI